jgi:hypothetical protein
MSKFISEVDLDTFEGWMGYQAVDPSSLLPEQLTAWRAAFNEMSKQPNSKIGMMKIKPRPGESLYAVAVREGSELWLTLWVRRAKKGAGQQFFVMLPNAHVGWDAHASYHLDGSFHYKSHGRTRLQRKLQPLTGTFTGTEHLGAYGGYAPKMVGAICDPDAFSGVLELPPGILGPRHGTIVVDLVEPGCDAMCWWFEEAARQTFKDALPWVVIRVGTENE